MSKKKKNLLQAKLIANPGAGKPDQFTARLEEVTHYLLDRNIKVDVALAHPKKVATPIAQKAAKNGYDLVIAMGGDGTIEAVLRGLVKTKTSLGIIPVGTANNIAKSLGIPTDLEAACTLIASNQVRKIDVGQVKKKKKKFRFLELTAIGLVAALYPQAKEIPNGRLSKLKDAATTLLHYDTTPEVILTMDGESKIKVETMLVSVVNTPIFGMNFLVSPQASLSDGLVDISVYPGFSKTELLAYFARVMNEGYSEEGRIQRYRARKIKIETRPKLDIMADGIMLGKGKATIKLLAGALRVIAPPEGTGVALPPEEAGKELPAPVSPSGVSTTQGDLEPSQPGEDQG